MMVVFGALRGRRVFWTMCISVGLHWLLLPVLFILWGAAVAQTRGWRWLSSSFPSRRFLRVTRSEATGRP